MKRLLIAATALSLMLPVSGAFAQNWNSHHDNNRHDDHRGGPAMMMHGPSHHSWRKGERFDRHNWGRYERVDYRRYHLRQPPRGYEWRRVDNNFILAAAATGLIASVIAASH
jgi:Ni/Co efflux regulator RcnB